MSGFRRLQADLQRRLSGLSLYARVAIANTAILLAGAILGTWLTHTFTEQGVELFSIFLLVLAGVTISILVNLWIMRAALQPFLTLRKVLTGLHEASDLNQAELIERALPEQVALPNPDADTRQIAASLSSLIQQLKASNRQLRLLSNRMISAQEEERLRIARSLHDDTAQALLTLMLNLERLEKRLPEGEAEIRPQLAQARQLASQTLNELRQTIAGLRPAILDDLGLIPAIRWYARSRLEEAGIALSFQAPEEELPLSPELRISLFRIAQEAINNIVRHSQAKSAQISLICLGPRLILQVEDDGRGFQLSQDQGEAIQREHWGLVGIQERVSLVGGQMAVFSRPGKGTRLEVSVPLSTCEEPEHGEDSHSNRG